MRSARPPAPLCALDDIADPGARGFEIETADGLLDIVVVRSGGNLFAYENACPHQGTPLETFPDRFMTADRTALLCTTHGALFRPHDGLCTRGPCKGKRLAPLSVSVADGCIYLSRP